MTRLFCHRFQANQVRLWLSLIAYNLGNLWQRRLALLREMGKLIAYRLATAGGEDQRPSD